MKPSGRLRGGSRALALFAVLGLGGCAAQRALPPPPNLPEVRFVPPCDPDAAIGLTAEAEQALVMRDQLMRARINQLESIIREDQ